MPAITRSIQKRAIMIQKFLKDSYISSDNYDSTQMPFFRRDNDSKEYEYFSISCIIKTIKLLNKNINIENKLRE